MLVGYTKSQQVILGVVAGIALLGLAILGNAVLQKPAQLTLVRESDRIDPSSPAPTPAGSSGMAPKVEIQIHVKGEVKNPGLQRLALDARVHDAIDAAGGPTAKADLNGVNLAAKLEDGSEVFVPERGKPVANGDLGIPTGPVTQKPGAGSVGSGSKGSRAIESKKPSVVSLNTATASQLDSLPGVGPATAAAILEYRNSHGGFATVEELMGVKGIGPKKFAKMRPFLRL